MVLVQDVLTDPLYEEVRAEWEAEGVAVPTRSAIALPFSSTGQPAGVFFLRTTRRTRRSTIDVSLPTR